MTISRIHHITFMVSDMDRSLHFYRGLLGFELVLDQVRQNVPAYDQVMNLQDVKVRVGLLNDPSKQAMLALFQYLHPSPSQRQMNNLFVGSAAMGVQTDDIDADYQRLQHAGVRFSSEPVDVVRDGKVAARLVYAFDPDGLVVELYQPS